MEVRRDFMNLELIIGLYISISFLELFVLTPCCGMDLSIFNPIRNYNTWKKLNWFGISVITLILHILFLPYAICYWIYKAFTVCRK
jgi:hypothetical protein